MNNYFLLIIRGSFTVATVSLVTVLQLGEGEEEGEHAKGYYVISGFKYMLGTKGKKLVGQTVRCIEFWCETHC